MQKALYKMNGTLTQTEIDETINRLRDRVGMHRMDLKEPATVESRFVHRNKERATYRAFRSTVCDMQI